MNKYTIVIFLIVFSANWHFATCSSTFPKEKINIDSLKCLKQAGKLDEVFVQYMQVSQLVPQFDITADINQINGTFGMRSQIILYPSAQWGQVQTWANFYASVFNPKPTKMLWINLSAASMYRNVNCSGLTQRFASLQKKVFYKIGVYTALIEWEQIFGKTGCPEMGVYPLFDYISTPFTPFGGWSTYVLKSGEYFTMCSADRLIDVLSAK